MNNDKLKKFLIRANKNGYAAGETNQVRELDKSYSTRFEEGDLSIHDNWFGGEPFGGREVVFYKSKPYWMMVYYGSDSGKAQGLIPFLLKALQNVSEEMPVRGPRQLKDGKFVYKNKWEGNLEQFLGVETIYYNNKEVYKARYNGGLVDQA